MTTIWTLDPSGRQLMAILDGADDLDGLTTGRVIERAQAAIADPNSRVAGYLLQTGHQRFRPCTPGDRIRFDTPAQGCANCHHLVHHHDPAVREHWDQVHLGAQPRS